MAKVKVGDGLCDRCGRDVVWKKADGGAYSYTCQHCDFRAYAPAETEAGKLALAEMKRVTPAPEKPAAAAVREAVKPAPAPAAAVPKRKSLTEMLAG